jgi:hypothetical protein
VKVRRKKDKLRSEFGGEKDNKSTKQEEQTLNVQHRSSDSPNAEQAIWHPGFDVYTVAKKLERRCPNALGWN